MMQIDLEAFVSVCRVGSSGRKIACEPLNDDDHSVVETLPGSFLLSKHAEFDWFKRNANLERKESTKCNGATATYNNSNSSSQRFSKSKAALIGLPKMHKNNFSDKRRCKPTSVRLFPPKRSESIEKARAQMKEPSSPKVSCIGRVRSKRSRRRRPESRPAKSEEKTILDKKRGFCTKFLALFKSERGDGSIIKTEELSEKSKKRMSENMVKNDAVPGLGGMTRFVSGRRSYETDGARRTVR